MAATETRMLLLGAVAIFEPVNGYQIRRELLSWNVQEWGNINPGSIYNGLATLARRGELIRHDLLDGTREVAVYETSEQGRAEFDRLFAEALTDVRPTAPLAFQTAFAMLPLCGRDRAAALLRQRLTNLDNTAEQAERSLQEAEHSPPHVQVMVDYWERQAELEKEWVQALLDRIEAGELFFQGEPMGWTPADDDPGRQMVADRSRYLALLGR